MESCSKMAKNVIEHANCVVKLISPKNFKNNTKPMIKKKRFEIYKKRNEKVDWIGNFGIQKNLKKKNETDEILKTNSKKRIRRNLKIIKNLKQPKLFNQNDGLSPLGFVAKLLNKSINNQKNRTYDNTKSLVYN